MSTLLGLTAAPEARELLSDEQIRGRWGDSAREQMGALVAIGPTLGLPSQGGIAFDELMAVLVDRAIAAWVVLASKPV